MQRFPCPFCGLRDETEFHFATEAGRRRPEPARAASDAEWAAYLHAVPPQAEVLREVWVHLPCGEFFVMARDGRSRAVLGSEPLPGRGAEPLPGRGA